MTNQTSSIIVTFDGKYLSYEQDGQLVKIPVSIHSYVLDQMFGNL
jgi:hypothetical protein